MPTPPARSALLILGATTIVAQSVLLREAMAALGGSEIAWGAVLAVWLGGIGLGAWVGVRRGSPHVARWLPSAVPVLAVTGAILFRAAPVLTGAEAGEIISAWRSLWIWVVAVAPTACAGGLAFPVLAAEVAGREPGEAYALEATGALMGGAAFTFLLAPLGSVATLVLTAGMAVAATVWPRWPLGVTVLALAALSSSPAADQLGRLGWRWADRPNQLEAWADTRQQRLELASGSPAALYADGRLVASFPDPYQTVPRTHMLMLLHPRPRRVLAVGALASGAAETMLRHPVERLGLTEDDPAVFRLLPEWYGEQLAATLADPRVELASSDPLRALRSSSQWDLILLLDGDPTTLRRNRTRTMEFFAACREHLSEGGMLVVQVGVSDTYLGGAGGRLLEILAATLRQAFPEVSAIPGENVFLVATRRSGVLDLTPRTLGLRWSQRAVDDPRFQPAMLQLLLDPWRAGALEETIRQAEAPLNTNQRPRAVLISAALSEGRSDHGLLSLLRTLENRSPMPLGWLILGVAAALLVQPLTHRPPGAALAAVIGFAAMGWWLLLLSAWQSSRGSVFAEVGLLTSLLMAGMAVGARWSSRHVAPERIVPAILTAGAALSGVMMGVVATRTPAPVVPAMLLVAGTIAGAAFTGAARLTASGDTRHAAGLAFAADELGAAAGALLVGLLAIPWAGAVATAAGIAVLMLAALPAAVVAIRR